MTAVIVGGSGFVGLNVAERLLGEGRPVLILDRAPPPPDALEALRALPGSLAVGLVDVTEPASVADAMPAAIDTMVLGAAITAGPARETADPESILAVNAQAVVPLLRAAARAGARRVLNLGSAAAYGAAAWRLSELEEGGPAEPESLYAVTKLASEGVVARLGVLWGLDVASLRLSGVYGPWERDTGVRDTLSPQGQVVALARAGQGAVLPREGRRDWIYAVDVAEAVATVLAAPRLERRLLNVSTARLSSVAEWGRAVSRHHPGFRCRIAGPGETPNVDLHAPADRAPLATRRLREETGWTARFDVERAAADLFRRARPAPGGPEGPPHA